MLSNQAMEREQQCVAEISLYPLCHDHVPVIREFIVSLERYKALSLSVSTTSTQVRGPYSFVFKVLGGFKGETSWGEKPVTTRTGHHRE